MNHALTRRSPSPRNNPNATMGLHILPALPHSLCQGNPWRYHATSILSSHCHLLWQCLAYPHPHCHSLAMWRLEYPTGMGPPLLPACSLCQSHLKALITLAVAMLQPRLSPAEQCVPPSIDCSLCQHGRFPASIAVPRLSGKAYW